MLHKCDVRLCVNPEHLFLGDQQANMTDMVSKNRQARGVTHALATDNASTLLGNVRVARMLLAEGFRVFEVAAGLKLSQSNVLRIRDRKTFKHLADGVEDFRPWAGCRG